MKNEIKKYIIAGFATLILTGCDLERLPYNEVSNENLDENSIETITRGSYAKLKEEYYYKPIHQVGEYGGDNVALSGTTSDLLYNTYSYRRVTTNYYMANLWQFSYQTMGNINTMIAQIKEGESDDKNQLLGENYFLRGFIYFHLCNVFGRPYAQSPDTNLGVPLKLTADVTDFPPRATVKEVYDQIVKDLLKAESLMGSKKTSIFGSKEVAQAYLSRVYLYMGEWQKAKEYADKVISSGRYTLLEGATYQSYASQVPEKNTETIFAIRMNKNVDFEKYHMGEYSVGAMYATIENVGWGEMYPSSSYLELLDKNPQDLRHGFIKGEKIDKPYQWLRYINDAPAYVLRKVKAESDGTYTIVENPEFYASATIQKDNGGLYVIEKSSSKKRYVTVEDAINTRNGYPKWFIYKCSLQEGQSQLYSPVMIRLGEIYLNRAEAEFKLGQTSAATADVNVIRTRAGIPLLSNASFDDIINERRLELAWEGQRKYDIYRTGATLNRNYPGSHLSGSPVHLTVKPESLLIVELIPQRELDAYPTDLQQNPQ